MTIAHDKTSLTEGEIAIDVPGGSVTATYFEVKQPHGLIFFAHGSGSSRHSSRNRFVAEYLGEHSFSSVLADLLTIQEDQTYANRFDIDLLTDRLLNISMAVSNDPTTQSLPIGYFGASTGAASAIRAAAENSKIKAVVSRGGRPDLAGDALEKLTAPILLLVGGNDPQVIDINKIAYDRLISVENKELKIITGANHLFEEEGALEEVAESALLWFAKYLH